MRKPSPLALIFVVVALDLIGFGIVIPLINLYGMHFQASTLELALLASAYSTMQFFFAPFWGGLSDKIGRRPVLLVSLCGSTASYLLFAFANSYALLLISRLLAGTFAANISAAQAYIADVTDSKSRAHGMGLIGAAFGIGFTLGPPVGGVSAHAYGMAAPGFIAAAFSGATLLLAYFFLPESLAVEHRERVGGGYRTPLNIDTWRSLRGRNIIQSLVVLFFLATFAFAQFEQAFSPYLQKRFDFTTELASYKAGLLLLWLGALGVIVQGFLVRKLLLRYSIWKLLAFGFCTQSIAFAIIPLLPTYESIFLFGILIPLGGGIANPCLSALISLNAAASEQGKILGIAQGFSSLARVLGPACALLLFAASHAIPFFAGGTILLICGAFIFARPNSVIQK